MKKLLLLMGFALLFCGVSYAENDNPEINDTNVSIADSEDATTNTEDNTTSTGETTNTGENTISAEDNTQTSSEENNQTVDTEIDSTVNNDENVDITNKEESQSTTSDNNEQTSSEESSQTTTQEDILDEEKQETGIDKKSDLITKIKEDIHEKIYSQEFQDAYDFASKNNITTMDSIDLANMEGGLNRISMAKMLSNYATNVLGKEPADITVPKFSDVSEKLNEEYGNAVDLAYQLGIMGIGVDKFRPYDTVTRAEFATALSRMLYGLADGLDKYYTTHMEKLKEEGIISNTDPSLKELRGYVMIMLMRSAKAKLGVIKDVIENKLVEDYKKLAEDNQILIDNL